MNKYSKTTVIYADSVDLTDRGWVEHNLKCDYVPYDQKHPDGNGCFDKICCKHAIPGRKTIQQVLSEYTKNTRLYSSGDTVALHMLAFAVLMECNPIYITGVDLDYRLGYAKNKGNYSSVTYASDFDQFLERIIPSFETIKESAANLGISIYNLSKISKLKMFDFKETIE